MLLIWIKYQNLFIFFTHIIYIYLNLILVLSMSRSKKLRVLKNIKLRNVRYALRTILRLEYEKRLDILGKKWSEVEGNESLTYEQKVRQQKEIIAQREQLDLIKRKYPINCAICGDRMEDLVWNPNRHQWRCVPCYEQAHKNFPEIYP